MGHKLTVPKNVQHCFHAMALDERRGAFMITRLDPEHDDTGRITEVWFRGVHSDVGGGNENVARSNIALGWMIENAIITGLPINRSKLATLKAEIDPFAAISANTDLVLDPPRIVDQRDSVHESAKGTLLIIGVRKKISVNSAAWQNWTGVEVVKGSRYRFHIDQTQRWEDASIACSPSGWSEDEIESIGFWKRIAIKIVGTVRKRCKSANWFEGVCSIGAADEHLVAIGSGRYSTADWVAPASGPLFAFANDAEKTFGKDFYKNNKGSVGFEIERVG